MAKERVVEGGWWIEGSAGADVKVVVGAGGGSDGGRRRMPGVGVWTAGWSAPAAAGGGGKGGGHRRGGATGTGAPPRPITPRKEGGGARGTHTQRPRGTAGLASPVPPPPVKPPPEAGAPSALTPPPTFPLRGGIGGPPARGARGARGRGRPPQMGRKKEKGCPPHPTAERTAAALARPPTPPHPPPPPGLIYISKHILR